MAYPPRSPRAIVSAPPSRMRTTDSLFGSPEENDRAAYVGQGMRDYDTESRRGPMTNPIQPVFDALKRKELESTYDGKNLRVNFGSGGVGRQETPMPTRRPLNPLEALSGGGRGGGFDVADDPRVQQAMVRRALDALDPMAEEEASGREMQDSALDQNRQEQRSLRSARDVAVPMNRIKQEMGDFNSEAEAHREFLPWRAGVNDQKFNRNLQLTTEPARIAAEGRREVADITGDSRVDAANAHKPDPIELLIDALGQTSKGAFGVDKDGRPTSPPVDLQQRLRDTLMGQTSPSGPARGAGPSRSGGAGPSTSASGTPPSNPKPGDKYRLPNGKMAVWANDDGTWGWYEDDGG